MPQPQNPILGTELRLHFTEMAYGGDVVARDPSSGMVIYAWPGIVGEEATVRVSGARKTLLRGLVTEVHSPSAERATPPCPVFGVCGGCQLQHMRYEAQTETKHEILRTQLARIAELSDPVLEPPLLSPRLFNYRNTSHFALDPDSATLGYFKRNSHAVVPISECPISNRGINRLVPEVNALLARAALGANDVEDTRGVMRLWKVVIRSSEATGHSVIVFHSQSNASRRRPLSRGRGGDIASTQSAGERPDIGPAPVTEATAANRVIALSRRELRRAAHELVRTVDSARQNAWTFVELMDDGTVNRVAESRAAGEMAANVLADALSGVSLGASGTERDDEPLGPPLGSWVEKLGALDYWIAPGAFFQVNTEGAAAMLAEVERVLPARIGLLVDAHAGVGTFGLAFANRANKIMAFETDSAAVAAGRWTAAANKIANVEFRRGRAEDLFARLPRQERPDVALLDPPRAGCHPRLLAELVARAVPLVVYVSCDPSTLARDLKILSEAYDLKSARLVDMFPQTYHIETVAVLELR